MRSVHDCGSLFDGQAAKESQFNDAGLVWIELFETVQRIVNLKQIGVRLRAERRRNISERDTKTIAAALCGIVGARMVYENAPHQLRRHAEKLRSITPVGPLLIEYFQVQLIHESCRLQCVLAAFATKIGHSETVQLVVNERHQPIERTHIAARPPFE
jgi:hypothetical protein